jgi:hypothetical protein
MDMLDLKFPPETKFDIVIDKAAMDALLTNMQDPWDPEEEIRRDVDRYLTGVSGLLDPQSHFVQISFAQPHFQKEFFQNDKYGWKFSFKQFGHDFSLGYFFYVLQKM